MSLKLIGIVLVSAIGFAQAPTPAPDPGDLWRKIRSALMAPEGDKFFQQIKDAEIPPERQRFGGNVVSQPSPNELIVNVDDPAGDAILRFLILPKRPAVVGTLSVRRGGTWLFKKSLSAYYRGLTGRH